MHFVAVNARAYEYMMIFGSTETRKSPNKTESVGSENLPTFSGMCETSVECAIPLLRPTNKDTYGLCCRNCKKKGDQRGGSDVFDVLGRAGLEIDCAFGMWMVMMVMITKS